MFSKGKRDRITPPRPNFSAILSNTFSLVPEMKRNWSFCVADIDFEPIYQFMGEWPVTINN